MQFEEAVRQGKNIFTEKPVATDAPGVRRFLAAAEEAKKKNLKVGVGLQRHHQAGYIETLKRLHDGQIGDIVSMRCYWNGTTPWVKPRADLERRAGRKLSEMEYQMRNWYYFVWTCGDHIVEQHIHNLDVMNWVKKGHPIRANGMGGVEVRKGPDYGEIFDHHCVEFEYEDGTRCSSECRHAQRHARPNQREPRPENFAAERALPPCLRDLECRRPVDQIHHDDGRDHARHRRAGAEEHRKDALQW